MLRYLRLMVILSVMSMIHMGCGDDTADTEGAEPTGPTFIFTTEPITAFSGPFPSDLLIDVTTGKLKPNLLSTDNRVLGFSNEAARTIMESRMIERDGFGANTAVFFPIDTEVDLSSARDRVHMISLRGADEGRRIQVRPFWSPYARSLGVFPRWSDYTVSGSRYLVWVESGVTNTDGEPIEAHPELTRALAGESDEPMVNMAFADAQQAISDHGGGEAIMATVFTTENPFDYLKWLVDSLDRYELKPLETTTRWDEETAAYAEGGNLQGDEITAYFGIPAPPFEYAPGAWTSGNRAASANLPNVDSPYDDGSFHRGLGMVVNGSFRVPAANYVIEDGVLDNIPLRTDEDGLLWSLEEMAPFTLVLCEDHLDAPQNVPVAVYSHGGNRRRGDLISYASVNCLNNVATFSFDFPFHAGRGFPVPKADQNLVVPGGPDTDNQFTNKSVGDDGFVPDQISDGAGPVQSVGNLLGINYTFDPAIAEGNTLGYTLNTYVALRHLTENDWTTVLPGLSFDPENIFQQAESFGASLTISLSAVTDRFKAVFWTAGAVGLMSPAALTAPDYGPLAGSIIQPMLGLKSSADEIQAHSHQDPMLSIWQWLIQRSDASPWAPMIIRHRQGPGAVNVLYGTSSWDSTLASTAQFMLTNALGTPIYRTEAWTLDSAIPDVPEDWGEAYNGTAISKNVTVNDIPVTAAGFHWNETSHVFATRPVTYLEYEKVYPPLVGLDEDLPIETPICAWQRSVDHMLRTTLANEPEIIDPRGDCEALYAP